MTTFHPIQGLDDAGGGKQLPTRQRIDDIKALLISPDSTIGSGPTNRVSKVAMANDDAAGE